MDSITMPKYCWEWKQDRISYLERRVEALQTVVHEKETRIRYLERKPRAKLFVYKRTLWILLCIVVVIIWLLT